MAVVAASGLVKTFGSGRAARRVLDGADLVVEAGEVVAILGRSGSGKSTLLHLLGGLDRPDQGTIDIAGAPVTGASERELIGLRPVAGTLPGRLSGGEQQRFAIARALVNDPALVLADEPTGNLDVEAGADVLRLLRSVATGGRAVVMVTHEPAAAAIADRVLELRDGKLVDHNGRPLEPHATPHDQRPAETPPRDHAPAEVPPRDHGPAGPAPRDHGPAR